MLQTMEYTTPIPPRPIRWANPNGNDMERWVSRCLKDEENLIFSRHAAEDRLTQRGFCYQDVVTILTRGHVYRVERGSQPGEIKANFCLPIRGRDAVVAALVNPSTSTVVVLTVMWADRTYYKP